MKPSGVIRATLTALTPLLCHHNVHCFEEGVTLKNQVIFTCLQMNWVSYFMHTLSFLVYIGQKAQVLMALRVTQGVTKTQPLFHFTLCLKCSTLCSIKHSNPFSNGCYILDNRQLSIHKSIWGRWEENTAIKHKSKSDKSTSSQRWI